MATSFPQFSLLPSELKLHVAVCTHIASVFGRLACCNREMAALCATKARWAMDLFTVAHTLSNGLRIQHQLPNGALHGEAIDFYENKSIMIRPLLLHYKANWVCGLLDGALEEWGKMNTFYRLIRCSTYRNNLKEGEEHLYSYNFTKGELVKKSVSTYARNHLCGPIRTYTYYGDTAYLAEEIFHFQGMEFTSQSEMERVMRNAQKRIDAGDNVDPGEEVYWPRV